MKKILYCLIVCLSLFGGSNLVNYKTKTAQNVNVINSTIDNRVETVLVYFPKLPDMHFASEELELDSTLTLDEKIYKIVDKLIMGPDSEELIDIMPVGTLLKKVMVKDNIAYLDFSKEFIDNHPGGSMGEYCTIYSIVNSVTELKEIEAVDFSIEGEKFTTYKGHCEFCAPIYKDELY